MDSGEKPSQVRILGAHELLFGSLKIDGSVAKQEESGNSRLVRMATGLGRHQDLLVGRIHKIGRKEGVLEAFRHHNGSDMPRIPQLRDENDDRLSSNGVEPRCG